MRINLLKKAIFVQKYGTYTNEMVVIAGVTDKKEVFRYLKKIKAKPKFSKWLLENFDDWTDCLKNKNKGLFCYNDIIGEGTVLLLRSPDDSWEYWEVLMHEIHHTVQHLAKTKMMFEEVEAQAYLFEFLFHSIRRKLRGVDKI